MRHKVTFDITRKIRERALSMKDMSIKAIVRAIAPDYPGISPATVQDIVSVSRKTSQYVMDLYYEGKLSRFILLGLGRSFLNVDTVDLVVREYVIPRRMSRRQLSNALRSIRRGMSFPEAFDRATEVIKDNEQTRSIKRINERMSKLPDDALSLMSLSRTKVRNIVDLLKAEKYPDIDAQINETIKVMAKARSAVNKIIDILPRSSLNKGKIHDELFHHAYLMRHLVKEQHTFLDQRISERNGSHAKFFDRLKELRDSTGEQYEFLDVKVKRYLDEMERYVASMVDSSSFSKEQRYGNPH